jgi:hypothetical protein
LLSITTASIPFVSNARLASLAPVLIKAVTEVALPGCALIMLGMVKPYMYQK